MLIARSISDAGGSITVKDTKTHQARQLALDSSGVEVLRRHHQRVASRAAAAGTAVDGTSYSWSQDIAARSPWRPDRVIGGFRVLTHRLQVGHVTFHSLRHFSATKLAGGGVAIRTIAGRLGHANLSLTLRTYVRYLRANT